MKNLIFGVVFVSVAAMAAISITKKAEEPAGAKPAVAAKTAVVTPKKK